MIVNGKCSKWLTLKSIKATIKFIILTNYNFSQEQFTSWHSNGLHHEFNGLAKYIAWHYCSRQKNRQLVIWVHLINHQIFEWSFWRSFLFCSLFHGIINGYVLFDGNREIVVIRLESMWISIIWFYVIRLFVIFSPLRSERFIFSNTETPHN